MITIKLNDKFFNYTVEGNGEPVIHVLGWEKSYEVGALGPGPSGIPYVAKENSLKEKYKVISYNNYNLKMERQLANDPLGPCITKANSKDSVNQVASECRALMDYLGIRKAHFFAHSKVGLVPLRLVLDYPEMVQSIALLEFELVPSSYVERKVSGIMQKFQQKTIERMQSPEGQQKMEEMRQKYEAAMQQRLLEHPDEKILPWRDRHPPEFLARYNAYQSAAVTSEPAEFQMKMRIISTLDSSPEDLSNRIRQPILSIVWDYSEPWAKQSAELLKSWLSQTELFTVPKRDHWFLGENTKRLADGLVDFFSRHPMNL